MQKATVAQTFLLVAQLFIAPVKPQEVNFGPGTSEYVPQIDGYVPGLYGEAASPGSYGSPAPPAGAADLDLETLTLVDTLAGLADGSFTSESLTLAYLEAIAKYEDSYNAFTFLSPDAVSDAIASDMKRAAGGPIGKLEGVPIVIKEALNVAGFPSTFGWNYTYAGAGGVSLYPIKNAPVVQMLIDEGAIVIGKTNIPAFSLSGTNANTSWAGVTYNAVNPLYAPGGSSAGTATAVAAGFSVWGIGEETGGSIQNPSSAQSLVGIKTTYGVVDTTGLAPLAGLTRDVLGPIAKTVTDAALAYDVMAGYGMEGFRGEGIPDGGYSALLGDVGLAGKKIGLYGPGWSDDPISEYVQPLYDTAIKQLTALGAEVVEDPFAGTDFKSLAYYSAESLGYDLNKFAKTLTYEGEPLTGINDFVDAVGVSPFALGKPLNSYLTRVVNLNESLASPEVLPNLSNFTQTRTEYRKIIANVFDKYDLAALVYPQNLAKLALLESSEFIDASTVYEINLAGTPVVTIPGPQPEDEAVPFGLAFTGPPHSEPTLLALAYDYEQAYSYRYVPELLVL